LNLLAVVTLVGFEKVATFLVMLSVLIVLHELGHFVVARRNGVRVNEFAVGFGPRLAGLDEPAQRNAVFVARLSGRWLLCDGRRRRQGL
jgi:membrane-associated protease RseP (regulator of RpoE activity)